MSDDAPTLEVGFAIDAGGSFSELEQLSAAMNSTEANVLKSAAQVERATNGMVKLGGATAEITTFGNAYTRAAHDAVREAARIERAGEKIVNQLERENAAFGKTKSELRHLKNEEAALAADRVGNTDLARRIREKEMELYGREFAVARQAAIARENAAEDAAAAEVRAIASVNAQLIERNRLEAALERNFGVNRPKATDAGATFSALAARAAEEEARATSLAAASAQRLAREHAELAALVQGSQAAMEADAQAADRLRMSTDPLYAATKRLNDEIAESTRLYHVGATAPEEYARQQGVLIDRLRGVELGHDAVGRGLGTMGNAGKLAGHHMQNLAFQFQDVGIQMFAAAQSGEPLKMALMTVIQQGSQIKGIMGQAGIGIWGVAKAFGAMLVPLLPLIAAVGTAAIAFGLFSRSVSQGVDTTAMVNGLGLTREEIKRLKNTSVTTGDVVKATFQVMARAVGINLGDLTKWFGDAMDWLTTAGRNTLAGLYASFVGTFRGIAAIVRGVFAGKSIGEIMSDVGGAYKGAFDEANGAMTKFASNVTKQLASNKLADLRKQAAEIKKDRAADKPKVDKHAEQLARDDAAIEAQIRNLYKLADAYGVSGAAALIAEARVKAETDAIKKRGDIEAFVDRQISLSIAQRVSDAAKASASLRQQADVQAEVNSMVAQGLIPAERAAELVRERIAQLPLLDAIEAAYQRNRIADAVAAEKELKKLRDAQADSRAAAIGDWFVQSNATNDRKLAELRAELALVGATDEARIRALATIRATNELLAAGKVKPGTPYFEQTVAKQVDIAVQTERVAAATREWNDALNFAADRWDLIAQNIDNAARGMADAFGNVGRSIGDVASIYAGYEAQRARGEEAHKARLQSLQSLGARDREVAKYMLATQTRQVGLYGDMASAAKGFFKEKSKGYQIMAVAEKAFRAIEFAMSVRSMAQDVIETVSSIANSGARAAAEGAEGIASQSKLPFPLNIAAMAATAGALIAAGIAVIGGGGGSKSLPRANDGTGSVLGDPKAQSDSIKRSIEALKEVDTLMLGASREMAASLKSIDSQIGGFAALVVRAGNVNASAGIAEGTKGGILGSLFGSKITITGSGLYGAAQSLGSILGGGFDASYYSDVEKKKKFLGITTGTSRYTQYTGADPTLERQFTLVLSQFNSAIKAAAGPLGEATGTIENRLSGFIVDIGKIDLKGLTGTEIQERLTAVFGAAADNMAAAAFPGLERLQKVGEGAFETLVRVASTVEAVTATLDRLGFGARALGIDAKVGLANQFDSVGDFTSAAQSYFETYYSAAEQSAAKAAQLAGVFARLGFAMPDTLANFRQLVEAQDLTSAAGRETYAMLLKLAPAFADLQSAMAGAKSAADILSERQDLERKLLELRGDTAAIRALDLAKVDVSNRALQQQIWAMQDAQEAARAADELRKAWTSVGDSIMAEVKRIRGLDTVGGGSFAALMAQFNAATASARGGDQDAAKTLPGISQALLNAAALVATSRQELARVQAETAASLESTYGVIGALSGAPKPADTTQALLTAVTTAQAATQASNDNLTQTLVAKIGALTAEVERMRSDNNAGHAATAGNTGAMKRTLDNVTQQSGGDAISTVAAA